MAVLTIYDVNQPCLRAKCSKVGKIGPAQQRLLDDMIETMRLANGVGLAAPQVGVTERLVVIEIEDDLFTLVNPEVVEFSADTETLTEGCLSLPNYYGPVDRPSKVVVKALDRKGKKIRLKADGWLARVLQHEIDHLDGVLFFDRMRSLSDLKYELPGEGGEGNDAEGSAGDSGDEEFHKVSERAGRQHENGASSPKPSTSPPITAAALSRAATVGMETTLARATDAVSAEPVPQGQT